MKFSRTWIKSALSSSLNPVEKNLLILIGVDFSTDDDVQVYPEKLALVLSLSKQEALDTICRLSDMGWLCIRKTSENFFLVSLSEPCYTPKNLIEKKTIGALSLETVKTIYGDKPVREWNPKDYLDYFTDKWMTTYHEDVVIKRRKEMTTMKHSIEFLSNHRIHFRVHPKVLYKQYIDWAIPKYQRMGSGIINNRTAMVWFLEQKEA